MNSSRRGAVSLFRSVLTLTIGGWLIFAFSTSGCNKEAPPAAPAAAPAPAAPPPAPVKAPLKIAFSDWPGWTAFEIGIQKGWFKEAGVDVEVRLVRVRARRWTRSPPARSTPSW